MGYDDDLRRRTLEVMAELQAVVDRQKAEDRERSLQSQEETTVEVEEPESKYHRMVNDLDEYLFSTNIIAKDYGWVDKKLNEKLRDLNIIEYDDITGWYILPPYDDKEYSIDFSEHKDKRRVGKKITWAKKGRIFIYEVLKKEGILPFIEQGWL